jgi:hypothetical protein
MYVEATCKTIELADMCKAWYAYDPSKQRRDCHWKVDVGIDVFGSREVRSFAPMVESRLTID